VATLSPNDQVNRCAEPTGNVIDAVHHQLALVPGQFAQANFCSIDSSNALGEWAVGSGAPLLWCSVGLI